MSAQQRLCRLDEIADGGSRGLHPDARGKATVLAVRRGQVVHAYVNLCPHYDKVRLGWRRDEFLNGDRSRIMCAAHGALFRPEDGVCVSGPCLDQRLRPVRTEVRDGAVFGQAEDLPRPEEMTRRAAARA